MATKKPSLLIEDLDPRTLVPYEHNNQTHPQSQIDRIAKSIKDFGFRQPIVIDAQNVVVIGHGRLLAALQMGLEKVPCNRFLGTEAEARALRIADNTIADEAEWKFEAIEFELGELKALDFDVQPWGFEDVLPPKKPEASEDDYEAPADLPCHVKRGDLIELGRHRVLCGDSTIASNADTPMMGEQCEMVWTDPPYGVAIGDKNKFLNSIARSNRVEENLQNDTLDEDGIKAMLRDAFQAAYDICSPGAAWYVAAPPGPLHLLFGQALKDLKIWRQTIQWVKNNSTFSPMGVDYHWQSEPIFYGWLPDAAHRYRGGRKQTTVWNIDRPNKSPEHPTMKPVELVARAIENSSDKGQIVYDPFLGSGTTLIAAEQLGRTCYGLEIEPRYCQIIIDRYVKWCEKSGTRPDVKINGEGYGGAGER